MFFLLALPRLVFGTLALLSWWYALMMAVGFQSGRVPQWVQEHAFRVMMTIAMIGVVAGWMAAR